MQLALILGLMTLACVTAWAAESDPEAKPTFGFMNIEAKSSFVTLTALDDSGQSVTEDNALFPGAVKIGVTCTNMQSGKEYLLIVQSGDNTTPNVDDMVFIDQKSPTSDGTQTNFFVIYPKKPSPTAQSVQYTVYMSSNADTSTGITQYEKVGSFEYYSTAPEVMLGDVDGDETIMVSDAIEILLYAVEDEDTLKAFAENALKKVAADVDRDGDIMVSDAVGILRYVAEDISSFDELLTS